MMIILQWYVEEKSKLSRILYHIMICCVCCVIMQNIVYSNAFYTCQKIVYDRTMLIYNRISHEIYNNENYNPDTVEIILSGELPKNTNLHDISMDIKSQNGSFKSAITYSGTFYAFSLQMGDNFKFDYDYEGKFIKEHEKYIKFMPCYPNKGYVSYIDGKIVVKLSD